MSKRRHYERFTRRELPAWGSDAPRWIHSSNSNREQHWESALSVLEQTRSALARWAQRQPQPNGDDTRFPVQFPDGETVGLSAREVLRYLKDTSAALGLPPVSSSPSSDEIQEALTRLSEALRPEPYRPRQGQQGQDGQGGGQNNEEGRKDQTQNGEDEGAEGDDGEGDENGEGDEQEGDGKEGNGKEGDGKEGQQSGRRRASPPRPPGRPKQDKKEKQQRQKERPQSGKRTGTQARKLEQQQQEAAPAARDLEEFQEQHWNAEPIPEPLEMPAGGGGGDQHYASPEEAAFQKARDAILRLCVARTPLERPELGAGPYNLRRVAKSAYNPAMLTSLRDELGLTVDDVYLLLDTSGSVAAYAPLIASIAAAAAGIVHLYTGTEARPQLKVMRDRPLAHVHDAFPEWRRQKPLHPDTDAFHRFVVEYQQVVHRGYPAPFMNPSFEAEMAWFLEREHPPKGSHIILWTDTRYCGLHNPLALKALLTEFHVTLMIPFTRDAPVLRECSPVTDAEVEAGGDLLTAAVKRGLEVSADATRCWLEVYKFLAIEIPVLFGVRDGPSFADALRRLS